MTRFPTGFLCSTDASYKHLMKLVMNYAMLGYGWSVDKIYFVDSILVSHKLILFCLLFLYMLSAGRI